MPSNPLSTVPLAVTAPAALASFAYLNARASLFYDWHTLGSAISGQIRCAIKEKREQQKFISGLTRRSYSSILVLLPYLFYLLEAAFGASVTISNHPDLSILS